MKSLFQHPSGDRPVTALLLLLTGVFALAFQDSLVKLMSSQTSFWQFQTLRSLGNLGFVMMLTVRDWSGFRNLPKKGHWPTHPFNAKNNLQSLIDEEIPAKGYEMNASAVVVVGRTE